MEFLPCHSCRVRKKKCYHLDKGDQVQSHDVEKNGRVDNRGRFAVNSSSETNTRESSLGPSRVTIYNPESVLSDLSNLPESTANLGQRQTLQKGPYSLCNPAEAQEAELASSQIERARRELHWYQRIKKRAAPQPLSDHYRIYLEEIGALVELPRTTTDALLPIYISVLDDLIPIVDGARLFRDYSNGQSSSYLVKAICLLACKATGAIPFLRTDLNGPVMKPLEFASKLLSGLDAAIKADLEPNRIIKVQVLALMHLHTDGFSGIDRAFSHLSQAICEAWSLSLHLKIPGNPEQDQNDFLWWTLRNFDRINKPVTGAAPFLVDDTDIGIERIPPSKDSYRSQVMDVALRLGDLMVVATKVHKASSKARVDQCHEFPSFCEITSDTDYCRFHKSHQVYLEVWYHVAAMLSCRYSPPGSAPYNRRLLSADRIVDIIGRGKDQSFPPLPLVPYSMSMSLTIIYRALRDNQRDINTACDDLLLCCNALDTMSQRWTSTKRIVQLARRLLRVLGKSTTMNSLRGHDRDNPGPGCEARPSTVTSLDNPTMRHQADNGHFHVDRVPKQVIGASQASNSIGSNNAANCDGSDGSLQQNLTEVWPGIDASYFQLDRAIYDLFDDSLPGTFQDPAAWNYVPFALNDNTYAGNDSHFAANFVSLDLELSNEFVQQNTSSDPRD